MYAVPPATTARVPKDLGVEPKGEPVPTAGAVGNIGETSGPIGGHGTAASIHEGLEFK